MIDEKKQYQLRDCYNPDGSMLRKAQCRMLEMLCFIDTICLENQITYWLDAGTLLGAVRHGGFIPWDDDVDICMPVKDAKRFKDLMLGTYNDGEFVLQCRDTDPGFFGPWLVLRDRKSEYIQDSHLHQARKYRGLQVDVFMVKDHNIPILKRGASFLERRLITKPLLKYRFSKFLKFSSTFWYNILYNCLFKVFDALGVLLSDKKYYTYSYGTSFADKHLIAPIFPLKRIEFEGKAFNAPNDTDTYLTESYGNWRRIPEDNEIETHHVSVKFYDEIR